MGLKVGLLTGGGDCPGLNAVIRAVVRKVENAGGSCIGVQEGWRGLIEDVTQPLAGVETDGIISWGGTILGSSRTNPYKHPEQNVPLVEKVFRRHELDCLVAIGGDDTLGVAARLWDERQLPMVGVPKTIDNDLRCTDFTFGFDTAVNVVMEAVDRLRTTAESHRRVMVVETMGRHAGWIACFSGMVTAADYILVPEIPIDVDHLIAVIRRRRAEGRKYNIVVVSEGAKFPEGGLVTAGAEVDDFGHVKLGGVGEVVADLIEKKTQIETRCVTLGHLQRSGPPSAYDRVLATRLGVHAANLVLEKRYGRMVALQGTKIVDAPLNEAVAAPKTLDLQYYYEAREFFRE